MSSQGLWPLLQDMGLPPPLLNTSLQKSQVPETQQGLKQPLEKALLLANRSLCFYYSSGMKGKPPLSKRFSIITNVFASNLNGGGPGKLTAKLFQALMLLTL